MGGVENTTSCSRLFASARFTPKLSVVVSHCLLKSARKGARSKLGKSTVWALPQIKCACLPTTSFNVLRVFPGKEAAC